MGRLRVATAVVVLTLAACDRDDDGPDRAAPAERSTATTTSTNAPSTTSTPAECPPATERPPDGAQSVAVTDFDGDRQGDPVERRDGIATTLDVYPSRGLRSTLEVPTAKPYGLMAAVDPDGDGDQELFVRVHDADHARVLVATFAGSTCNVAWAANAKGEPYEFIVTTTAPSASYDGMGCVDVDGDGGLELVGLHGESDGDLVRWTRTVVELRDGRAENGPVDTGTFRRGPDDAAIALLGDATCGDSQFKE